MNKPLTIVVGMSGGVDSSVVAYLLKQAGHKVIGLFMKNWDEVDEKGVCSADEDYQDVIKVCEKLDIPYYSINLVDEYRDAVFSEFLKDYREGETPNPDVLCNREIKFKVFWEKAKLLGADKLATGHYAQIKDVDGIPTLFRGFDSQKDQSYFLSQVPKEMWANILFPIGHLTKPEVRKIAQEAGLATMKKKDSTGICFIGERSFKPFLKNYIEEMKGNFINTEGKVLGPHDGICFYTIGQRKGLGIGGPGEAWFVAAKNKKTNDVMLVQGEHHPALYAQSLEATDMNWMVDPSTLTFPLKCSAKVRYRQVDENCTVHQNGGTLCVKFDRPIRAITTRQVVVLYLNDLCLGGAFISAIGPSLWEQSLAQTPDIHPSLQP